MIPRYSLPEMASVWSEERKLEVWKEIEVLALEGWEELGAVPRGVAEAVRARGKVDLEAVRVREEATRHDVAAFVDVLAESVGEGGEWVHYGLTSSDVLDTAQGALLKEATGLLLRRVEALFDTVRRRAEEHRRTVMLGRTHGMWAEPTTFGLKLAGWAFELSRAYRRLARAGEQAAVGKLSGAVGTYASVPPEVERRVCERLGLGIEPASTQVVSRDRHAELLSVLAQVGASLERFATEIRLLQSSEVAEVSEPFGEAQKGSSSMPHKRNPVRSERICGLARLLRGYAQTALENVALWHERDISHSSAERVAVPDAFLALDFALADFREVLEGLHVDAARMKANLEATRGLVFSQAVMLRLVTAGLERDRAYRIVQEAAARTAREGPGLREVLEGHPEVDPAVLDAAFDPATHLARAGVVFERLGAIELGSG